MHYIIHFEPKGEDQVTEIWFIDTVSELLRLPVKNVDLQLCYTLFESDTDDNDISMAKGLAKVELIERVWACDGPIMYRVVSKMPWTDAEHGIYLLEKDTSGKIQYTYIGQCTYLLPWERV